MAAAAVAARTRENMEESGRGWSHRSVDYTKSKGGGRGVEDAKRGARGILVSRPSQCDILTRWGCIIWERERESEEEGEGERERERKRKRKRIGKASQVRNARCASELTWRPPTITESIDQLGDLVAAHRSGALATASPTLLNSGLPLFSVMGMIRSLRFLSSIVTKTALCNFGIG